ncbi:importin-7 [Trichonephila clavata]|uniref:Importin-7 n=1 Tax=Trichonephila clavata TaxID=2740835 RepID=A0A8X6H1W7_TRICU|nr:importin-7 [Trichonephila clavata]
MKSVSPCKMTAGGEVHPTNMGLEGRGNSPTTVRPLLPYTHVLGSDEDDVNEEYPELSKVSREIKKKSPFPVTSSSIVDDDEATDDEEYEEAEETALEGYTTPLDDDETTIDEYIIFKEVMNGLKTTDPNWYNILTSHLTAEQQRAFEEVMVLADQRKAAAESKRIEKSGGYVFQNQTVPTSFNFGGTPLS